MAVAYASSIASPVLPAVFTFPLDMSFNPSVPFTFSSTVQTTCGLVPTQPPPPPLSVIQRKRARPTAFLSGDDEDDLPSAKKRRLRLLLITSRLSRPFSKPATYIADHGRSRIAVWAKARQLRSRSLRKAAILNCARKTGWASGTGPDASAFEERVITEGSSSTASLGRRDGPDEDVQGEAEILGAIRNEGVGEHFLDASPLGLSNYEEFHDWKGYVGTHDEDDPGGCTRVPQTHMHQEEDVDDDDEDQVYSDFNFLDPVATSPQDDDDYDDPFAVLPPDWYQDHRPLRAPDGLLSSTTPPEPVGVSV
jgi:hypothetical protein